MDDQIILSDLGLVIPPQSSLPKEEYTFVLCRLTQYPSRDKERKIIEDEYTNCCFTSAFGKQANLSLGKNESGVAITLSLTASKWRRNTDGNITNPSSGDQLTYWFDDTDQAKLKYVIENNIYYVYGDTANPDADLMLPKAYETHIATLKGQTKVIPIDNTEPDKRVNVDLIGG